MTFQPSLLQRHLWLGLLHCVLPVFVWAQAAEPTVRVGIYSHSPETASGPRLLERFLTSEAGFTTSVLSPQQIREGVLGQYDVVILPGGSGSAQSRHLEESGLEAIREFVRGGGGYVGICAGAYLATTHYDWSLGIINAEVLDRDDGRWARGSGTVTLSLTESGQRALGHDQSEGDVFYRNGPLYGKGGRTDLPEFETLATFATAIAQNNNTRPESMLGTVAIARSFFGAGRVVAISPHPESPTGHNHWVASLVKWAAGAEDIPAYYTGKAETARGMIQTDPEAGLPRGGRSSCGPVSMANSLFSLEAMGYEGLIPEAETPREAHLQLARILADQDHTNIAGSPGTSVAAFIRAARTYLGARGHSPAFQLASWRTVSGVETLHTHPSWEWLKRQIPGDRLIWLNVGWYRHDQETDVYHRSGGHWISVVGYGLAGPNEPDPNYLLIHDSNWLNGMEAKMDYVRVETLPSGSLVGPSWVTNTAGFAAGLLHLTDNFQRNPDRADNAIIDAIVILSL
jgi:glutamine amidotransferase-like uncharacterized protein